MTLDELSVGTSAEILAVGGEGAQRLRLLDLGLIPRTRVMLCCAAPLGDPIGIHLRGGGLTLRRAEAQKITVRPVEREAGGLPP